MTPTQKRIIAGVAAVLSAVGLIACLTAIILSWSLNNRLTNDLTHLLDGAEQLLTTADAGLTRLDSGLTTALTAVTTVDEAVRGAGQTLVDTNLVFVLLDRTVGDTLFPRITAAHETATALADTIVGINATLEAANRLPFVEVPTISAELQTAANTLEGARTRVAEIQAELRAIKEEKVSRPVSFITDRTTPIIQGLATAQTALTTTQTRVGETLAAVVRLRERLPRLLDWLSLGVTLVALWLLAAQGYVLLRAYEHLTGRPVDWERLKRGTRG